MSDLVPKTQAKEGVIHSCVVEGVFPFGVFVRLGDGSRGYIRKRELTLSGETDPRQVVSQGDKIKAAVLVPTSSDKVELSVKATYPDPWPGFVQRHGLNDVVAITVKHLYGDGVLVEIVPGVDGFIPLSELASAQSVAQPEDVIWPGDRSEAVITYIDLDNKRVQLSIRRWTNRLAKVELIMQMVRKDVRVPEDGDQNEGEALESSELTKAKIALGGPILVVEDQDTVRNPLVDWLTLEGCLAIGAPSGSEALNLCKEQNFALAMIDLDMPEKNGIDLIHELRRSGYGMAIAVMSDPELIAEQMPSLRQEDVVTAFPKPLDQEDIRHALLEMSQGKQPNFPFELEPQPLPKEVEGFQTLSSLLRISGSTVDRLQRGLDQLVRDVRADKGAIFHVDLVARAVSIMAQTGQPTLPAAALYQLIDSPVKDVILGSVPIWENLVSSKKGRFRKLLDLMPFESCIGIPLEVSGRTEHAIFLFHRDRDAFSPYRLRDAFAAATLFCAVLESHALEEKVQTVSRVLLSGQLASAFGHEVYNKVSGLDLQISNVRTRLLLAAHAFPDIATENKLHSVNDAIGQAAEIATELKRTVQDFQRLTRSTDEDLVDVNKTVLAAKMLVNPLALRHKAQISLELGADLSLCLGSSIRLQQVFLNLMLNAVQQMVRQPEERRSLRVTTTPSTVDSKHWVHIRFTDTGPGIHKKLWDKVFALGYTTREDGSGLGLFIARSLVESMQGRIVVEESLIQLGTTFLVELSALASPLPGLGAT